MSPRKAAPGEAVAASPTVGRDRCSASSSAPSSVKALGVHHGSPRRARPRLARRRGRGRTRRRGRSAPARRRRRSPRTRRGTPRRCGPGRRPGVRTRSGSQTSTCVPGRQVVQQLQRAGRRAPGSATPCPRRRCPRRACRAARPARGARRAAPRRAPAPRRSAAARGTAAPRAACSALVERALVGGREVAQLVDLVAPELHPHRVLLGGREDVEHAAADGELAALLDQLDAGVGGVDQAGRRRRARPSSPACSSTGTRSPRPGSQRLQHAAHRGDDDRTPMAASSPGWARSRSTASRRPTVSARGRQPLVRQRLPRRDRPRRRPASRHAGSAAARSSASRPVAVTARTGRLSWAASAAMANGRSAAGAVSTERPAAPSAASAEEIARSSTVAANSPDNGILADSTAAPFTQHNCPRSSAEGGSVPRYPRPG